MPIKIHNRGLCNLLHRLIKRDDCSWLKTPEQISLTPGEKVLPCPFPFPLVMSTLAIRWLFGHLDQCWCGSVPACMISNGGREQKCFHTFHSMLWLGVQTLLSVWTEQVLRRGFGLCEPNCERIHLETEPLCTEKEFRCCCGVALQNLKTFLNWMVWREDWSPFCHP